MTTNTYSIESSHEVSNKWQTLASFTDITGRVLIAAIFLMAGINKIGAYEGTAQYMVANGLPDLLLPLVILLEIGGAIAIILGFQTRLVALGLAGFCILSGIIFHGNIDDQMQMIMMMKNFAIAGGFLVIATHGAGRFSIDQAMAKH